MASASRPDNESLFILSGDPAMTPHPQESLVALTQDQALLATLHAVAPGRRVAIVAAEADLAIDLLSARSGVVVIDTAAVTSPIAKLTGRLKEQFPDLVLVVAGSSGDQSVLAAQIGSGMVYRFLHKPLSEQRVKLVMDAAWRRHGEEHAGITGLVATRTVRAIKPPRSHKGLWILGMLAALAIGALWIVQQPPPRATRVAASVAVKEPTAAAAAPAVEAAPSAIPPAADGASPVIDRTEKPEPVPPGEPIVPAATRAATMDKVAVAAPLAPAPAPVDTAAQLKQRQLTERLLAEARKAFAANNMDEGSRWMQAAQEAGASEEDLDSLTRDAERLRLALRAETITRLSKDFNERLARGKLVEPAGDSAKFYLAQLQQTDADHPVTRLAQQSLAARLLAEARSFLPRQDFAAARRWLVEARDAGAAAASIAAVEREIDAAPQPAAQVAAADEDAAGRPLKQIRHIDPEYPDAARKSGATGWVDVAYTVRSDGSVGEVAVIQSEPSGIFDKAALAAVRKWRYEPAQPNAQPQQRRTKVRIRFELR